MGNRLMINMESRILGDGYVRFGGEYMGTWHFLKCQSTVCLAYGTGKTLIMCIAAHEMKRLNLAHKPMIIGLKANVAEIAATYQTFNENYVTLWSLHQCINRFWRKSLHFSLVRFPAVKTK